MQAALSVLQPAPSRTAERNLAWLRLALNLLQKAAAAQPLSSAFLWACVQRLVPWLLETACRGCPAAAVQADVREQLVAAMSAVLLACLKSGCEPV